MAIGIVYYMSQKVLRDELTVLNLHWRFKLKWVLKEFLVIVWIIPVLTYSRPKSVPGV